MLFPEADLRAEFWNFLDKRSIGPHSGGRRAKLPVLDKIENRRDEVRYGVDDDSDVPPLELDDLSWPRTYPTLQEALLAFLIDHTASREPRITYEVWLRTVTLIVADAAREPDRWLKIKVTNRSVHVGDDYGPPKYEHTMIVSGDWQCLSSDTFKFVIQTYGHVDC